MYTGKRAKKIKKWKEPRRLPRQMPLKTQVSGMYFQMLDELMDEGVERDAYDTIMDKKERCRDLDAFK